jgi:hypothetical protein
MIGRPAFHSSQRPDGSRRLTRSLHPRGASKIVRNTGGSSRDGPRYSGEVQQRQQPKPAVTDHHNHPEHVKYPDRLIGQQSVRSGFESLAAYRWRLSLTNVKTGCGGARTASARCVVSSGKKRRRLAAWPRGDGRAGRGRGNQQTRCRGLAVSLMQDPRSAFPTWAPFAASRQSWPADSPRPGCSRHRALFAV